MMCIYRKKKGSNCTSHTPLRQTLLFHGCENESIFTDRCLLTGLKEERSTFHKVLFPSKQTKKSSEFLKFNLNV